MSTSTVPFDSKTSSQSAAPGDADGDDAEIRDLLLSAFGSWAKGAVDPEAIESAGILSPKLVAGAASVGLFGLSVPERYEGAGLSMTGTARIVEEVATLDRSLATSVGLHNGLGLQPLITHGSEALKAEYLPKFAAGMVAAFCATEPNAGSHIAGIRTTAEQTEDGDLLLNGEKIFVTNGALAGAFTVLARTPGLGGARRGTSLLFLDRDMPGLTVGPEERKLGIKASSTTSLRFDDVRVPLDRVLGTPGKGLEQMHHALTWGRTLMAAGALGTGRAGYVKALAYVQERKQFGRAIGKFGQVRGHIVAMEAGLWAAQSVIGWTTRLSDQGVDIGWHSAIAKVFASEVAGQVVDTSLQLHGGNGYMLETGIGRMLRDCRITRIYEGANDVLRMSISAPLFGKGSQLGKVGPLAGSVVPRLQPFAARHDQDGEQLQGVVAELRAQLGIRVHEHQVLLAGVADAVIAHAAMGQVLKRTDGLLREADGPKAEHAAARVALLSDHLGQQLQRGLVLAQDLKREALIKQSSEYLYGS